MNSYINLENKTPFKTAHYPVCEKDGIPLFFTAVKALYHFNEKGVLTISDRQRPVEMADQYTGDPGKSSLQYASDFSFDKTATDIVVVGNAHITPYSDRESYIYLKTETLSYIVKVFGPRHFIKSLGFHRISAPQPFTHIPLTYENAFGGSDSTQKLPEKIEFEPKNPVGKGFCVKKSSTPLENRPLPNFEDPDHFIQSPYDRPSPQGFGFIAPSWEPRIQFVGTYDKGWEETKLPGLPKDFDARFFNVAHPNLIYPGFMRGDETIELAGVSQRGKLNIRLPGITPRCLAKNGGHQTEGVELNLDRVVIYPDDEALLLLWTGTRRMEGAFRQIKEILISL